MPSSAEAGTTFRSMPPAGLRRQTNFSVEIFVQADVVATMHTRLTMSSERCSILSFRCPPPPPTDKAQARTVKLGNAQVLRCCIDGHIHRPRRAPGDGARTCAGPAHVRRARESRDRAIGGGGGGLRPAAHYKTVDANLCKDSRGWGGGGACTRCGGQIGAWWTLQIQIILFRLDTRPFYIPKACWCSRSLSPSGIMPKLLIIGQKCASVFLELCGVQIYFIDSEQCVESVREEGRGTFSIDNRYGPFGIAESGHLPTVGRFAFPKFVLIFAPRVLLILFYI